MEGLTLSHPIRSARDVASAQFLDALRRRGLSHVREAPLRPARSADVGSLPATATVWFALRDVLGQAVVFGLDEGAVYVVISRDSGHAVVAAASPAGADRLVERVTALFDDVSAVDDTLPVTFWTAGTHSPRALRREVSAPAWPEVAANYDHATAREISALIDARVPAAGRLILWHGAPGTGKTTALRALARAWTGWCATHFVTDPERFLGSATGYLLEVLAAEPDHPRDRAPGWKMVVLEDAGELLGADAHARTGQALSRLLNLTDGVLGQGSNVVLLVTTNEPLRALHPAVTRPGRCWSTTEFRPLGAEQANRWLAAHESSRRITQPATLADLYAMLRGRETETRRPFGFGVSAAG